MATTRVNKRQRTSHGGAYHDRVPLQNDFEVVHARESYTISSSHSVRPAAGLRSPQRGRTSWTVGSAWEPEDSTELSLDPNGEWYDEEVEASVMTDHPSHVVEVPPKRRHQSKVARRPHVVWKELYRGLYLDELIRWEGRGDVREVKGCPDCIARKVKDVGDAEYRCAECFLLDLVCSVCCVRRHRRNPLHRVERWTGTHFVQTTLKDMGLRIQLNHVSMQCPTPIRCHQGFRVLHTNGIHDVALDYCGCRSVPPHIQLLRRGFYPASQRTVKTCASFDLLRLLHLLALTTKGSTYDFYRTLEKLSNNTGIFLPPSRYKALLRMTLQWRHLKMLKRGGRGHDPTGVEGTKEGELAVLCPSCPRPGINLSEGWETVSDENKFLYMLMVCMDANFRLKNQLVSTYSADPGLGTGLAYMVARAPYENYVLSHASDGDISTCVGFAAIAGANTRFLRGLRYTGVGGMSCARGEMLLPNGVGNLQKGERYANMDYIFASALRDVVLPLVLISYDIACQWPGIPKLHEPAHQQEGHEVYSFHNIPGVGLTDGECPERIWAGHNMLGNSTKTQGPGSRQDVLDDHFGFWNWQKYNTMGPTLMRRYKAAIRLRNVQVEGHRGFTASLPQDTVDTWEAMCVAWDAEGFSKKGKSPFHTDGLCLSEVQVRKELADEEEGRLAGGGAALHQTSASSFLVMGLEIEDSQRRLQKLAKAGEAPASLRQGASLTEQRNVLRTKIRNWEQLRSVYMPGLLQYISDLERARPSPATPTSSNPEDVDLYLPSQITANRRDVVCRAGLADMEEKLRTAQCYDSLDGLRHVLRMKTRMIQFKNKNVRGQRDGTRSRAVIDRVHERARAHAAKYRVARAAKMSLGGPGSWTDSLKPLLDADIRAYTDPDRIRRGPGRRGTVEDEDLARMSVLENDRVGLREDKMGRDEAEEEDEDGTPRPTDAAGDEDGIQLIPQPRTRRDGTGETRRTLSWIWASGRAQPTNANDSDHDDILRAEWAKSRARSNRAREEVQLLREEMRRVLVFLQWKGTWWRGRAQWREELEPTLKEGVKAYALEQASLQDMLALSFRKTWRQPLEEGIEELMQELNDNDDPDAGDGNDAGDDDDDDDDDEDDDEDPRHTGADSVHDEEEEEEL
ncbi:hypothetical protein Hypma_009705 [Hypsizygus marmoreus]|uniref:CxC2-like cysteine cluster KDZ transposase-associated domain-containing protein n=1 Tax=Hypsizygus marmoreus TaxID=39966 RepID=A0A369JRV2_HYPMA|nr:hypothetical protein Hypma_009705 [Hypsizygus marmoreus]